MTETTPAPQEHTYQHPLVPLSQRQLKSLLANLNQNRISSRRQSGRNLSYLEAWDVKAALIKVFGFGGFSAVADEAKVVNTEMVPKPAPRSGGPAPEGFNYRVTVMVRVRLKIHQLGAEYAEYAASSQTNPDPGDAMDFAIKTAESDALKRAAIYLGTQFGLSLYDDGSINDVVRVVLAPGQEWPAPAPALEQTAGPGAAGVPNSPAARAYPEPAPGVTPEQHQKNLALLDRALTVKQAKDGETVASPPDGEANTGQSDAPEQSITPAGSED